MKGLVIGYGSIGARHASVLEELGVQVSFVTNRDDAPYHRFLSVQQAIDAVDFDLVIIANPTAKHYETLLTLISAGYRGKILIEKPLFHQLLDLPKNCQHDIFVGYNLRFHPVLQQLKKHLCSYAAAAAIVQVGQYLPSWRPQRDYRKTYSALKEAGGGVLRDLSHELDYVVWLLGACRKLTASGSNQSQLELTSEDVYTILMQCSRCPHVAISLDYLRPVPQRQFNVIAENSIIEADLIQQTICINGEKIEYNVSPNDTYRKQIEALISEDYESLCSLAEGYEVLRLIEQIEYANQNMSWVIR
ncbi:MAG: Gfo/Idh/MocA family oxidoreductase [Gammaproteobacteria bacterium]|jgi:predicted dehydrogenase